MTMRWQRADSAAAQAVNDEGHYMVITNEGTWGGQCLYMWRGYVLKHQLCEQQGPGRVGRTRVECYAEVQPVEEILRWARGV